MGHEHIRIPLTALLRVPDFFHSLEILVPTECDDNGQNEKKRKRKEERKTLTGYGMECKLDYSRVKTKID